MKKCKQIITILLVVSLLVACGKTTDNQNTPNSITNNNTVAVTDVVEKKPLLSDMHFFLNDDGSINENHLRMITSDIASDELSDNMNKGYAYHVYEISAVEKGFPVKFYLTLWDISDGKSTYDISVVVSAISDTQVYNATIGSAIFYIAKIVHMDLAAGYSDYTDIHKTMDVIDACVSKGGKGSIDKLDVWKEAKYHFNNDGSFAINISMNTVVEATQTPSQIKTSLPTSTPSPTIIPTIALNPTTMPTQAPEPTATPTVTPTPNNVTSNSDAEKIVLCLQRAQGVSDYYQFSEGTSFSVQYKHTTTFNGLYLVVSVRSPDGFGDMHYGASELWGERTGNLSLTEKYGKAKGGSECYYSPFVGEVQENGKIVWEYRGMYGEDCFQELVNQSSTLQALISYEETTYTPTLAPTPTPTPSPTPTMTPTPSPVPTSTPTPTPLPPSYLDKVVGTWTSINWSINSMEEQRIYDDSGCTLYIGEQGDAVITTPERSFFFTVDPYAEYRDNGGGDFYIAYDIYVDGVKYSTWYYPAEGWLEYDNSHRVYGDVVSVNVRVKYDDSCYFYGVFER